MANLVFNTDGDLEKVIKLRQEIERLETQLKQVDASKSPETVRVLQKELTGTKKELTGLVGAAAKAGAAGSLLKKTFNKLGGTEAVKALIMNITKVRGEFQAMELNLQGALGSKEKADQLMNAVKEYMKTSPLSVSDVSAAAQTMAEFGIEAEKIPDFLSAIGDISMGNTDKFNALSAAFSQISSTGQFMEEDLTRLVQAGFNPLSVMAESTGMSMAQLKEEMANGAISTAMVQDAFIKATEAGGQFYNKSDEASKTINGQLAVMQNALDAVFNELGEKGEGVIGKSIETATSLIQNYETVGKVLMGLVAMYGAAKAALFLYTEVTRGYTITQALGTAATIRWEAAQKALNLQVLKNPYVLVATAVVGLATAMWAFADSSSEAEKMQEQYNKSKEIAIRNEQEHKQKISDLISIIQNEATAILEREAALNMLKKAYPGIIEDYITEEGHLHNLIGLKERLAEVDSKNKTEKNKIDIASLDQKIKNKEEYILRMSGSKEAVQDEVKALEELKRQRRDLQTQINADILNERINKLRALSDEELKRTAQQYRASFSKTNGEMIGQFSRSEIESFIKTLEDMSKARENAIRNKEYWENKKKQAEAAKYALGVEKENSEEWNKYESQILEAQQKIDKYNSKTNHPPKKDQSKTPDELLKLQQKNEQERIQQLKNEGDRVRKQIEYNYKREKEELEKQEKAWRDIQNGILTPEQESALNKALENAGKRKNTETENQSKKEKQALDELLTKYQNYTDQRLAIEKKYNSDINELRAQKRQAEKNNDPILSTQIDRAIAQATKNKGKELIAFDFKLFKENPEYVHTFENLKNTSTETLNSLIQQLTEQKEKASKVLNPSELKEYTSIIQQILDELVARDPFQALRNSQQELAQTERELAEAENTLSKVKSGALIIANTELDQNGKITAIYLSENQALQNVSDAKKKYVKASTDTAKAQKSVIENTKQLYTALSGVGEAVGGTAGEILTCISDIGNFINTTIEGIEKTSRAGQEAVSAVEKASVILAIIAAAIQLMQKLGSLIPDAHDDYKKYAEKVTKINKLRDAVNQYELAILKAKNAEKSWFGSDNLEGLKNAADEHERVYQAYRDKLEESQAVYQNESGGGWLTTIWKPINWLIDNTLGKIYGFNILRNYKEGQTAAVNNLRIETKKKSKGFLGTGIGGNSQKTEDLIQWVKNNLGVDLFDTEGFINTQVAQSVLDNYGDKLVGQTKATIEELIKLKDQYDEYMQKLRDYVSSLYEPLVDNFVDAIWDWFGKGKDALDSFKEYAAQTFKDIAKDLLRTLLLEEVFTTTVVKPSSTASRNRRSEDGSDETNSYSGGSITTSRKSIRRSDSGRSSVQRSSSSHIAGSTTTEKVTFQDRVLELYKQLSSGAISHNEFINGIAEITGELEVNLQEKLPVINEMMSMIDETLKGIGIDIFGDGSKEQQATNRGFETMSQDTASELNGRFTALQMAGEEIKFQNMNQTQALTDIKSGIEMASYMIGDIQNISDETRTILANSYLELQSIRENTEAVVKPIREMNDKLGRIEENTKGL